MKRVWINYYPIQIKKYKIRKNNKKKRIYMVKYSCGDDKNE